MAHRSSDPDRQTCRVAALRAHIRERRHLRGILTPGSPAASAAPALVHRCLRSCKDHDRLSLRVGGMPTVGMSCSARVTVCS